MTASLNKERIYTNGKYHRVAQKNIDKYFYWLSFFMAFPGLLFLGQNLSLFILFPLVVTITRFRPVIRLTTTLQWLALFFGIGSILSVANMPDNISEDAFSRAIGVLPNFLYWSFLVIFLVTHRDLINLNVVFRAIYWGLLSTLVYYLFFVKILSFIPIFRYITPNDFAFIMICFTPIAIYHQLQKSKKSALVLLVIFVIVLLLEGRRAGMVLVFLGGIAVLFSDKLSFGKVIFAAFLLAFLSVAISTAPIKSFIYSANERIYDLIYNFENIQKEDRSYLTRVAMVNKGLAIFADYPYTGIGLNNFTNYHAEIIADFEGANYVIHKHNINTMSAHNSYVSILAEGGLLLFLPFVLILAFCIIYFIFGFRTIQDSYKPVFIAVIAMSIHLYFVSAIVNVYAWYLIGLASALCYRKLRIN